MDERERAGLLKKQGARLDELATRLKHVRGRLATLGSGPINLTAATTEPDALSARVRTMRGTAEDQESAG